MLRKFLINSYSGLPKEVWYLSLITLINRTGSTVFMFLALYLSQSLKYNSTDIGMILGGYGLGAVIGNILGGTLVDLFGAFPVLLIGLFGSATVPLLFLVIKSKLLISLLVFLLATFVELVRPANAVIISFFSSPTIRAKAFALDRQAINIGCTIGPAVGGILAAISYSFLFVLDSITSLGAILVLITIFNNVINTSKLNRSNIKHNENQNSKPKKTFEKSFILFLVIVFLSSIIFYQLYSTYPLYLTEFYKISKIQFGLLMSFCSVLVITCEMLIINYFSRMNKLTVIGLGCFLMGLAFLVLPLSSGFIYAMVTIVIFTIGEMLSMSNMSGYAANLASTNNYGKYMGLYSAVFSSGCIIAPYLGTTIFKHYGSNSFCLMIGILGVTSFIYSEFLKLYNKNIAV
jgi:predicted MFS family arabinose efflux permease